MIITVVRTETGFDAVHSGPGSERIQELFGTRALPTAFTPFCPITEVLINLRQLNPGVEVTLPGYPSSR